MLKFVCSATASIYEYDQTEEEEANIFDTTYIWPTLPIRVAAVSKPLLYPSDPYRCWGPINLLSNVYRGLGPVGKAAGVRS
jgi:hypothetical protein